MVFSETPKIPKKFKLFKKKLGFFILFFFNFDFGYIRLKFKVQVNNFINFLKNKRKSFGNKISGTSEKLSSTNKKLKKIF